MKRGKRKPESTAEIIDHSIKAPDTKIRKARAKEGHGKRRTKVGEKHRVYRRIKRQLEKEACTRTTKPGQRQKNNGSQNGKETETKQYREAKEAELNETWEKERRKHTMYKKNRSWETSPEEVATWKSTKKAAKIGTERIRKEIKVKREKRK